MLKQLLFLFTTKITNNDLEFVTFRQKVSANEPLELSMRSFLKSASLTIKTSTTKICCQIHDKFRNNSPANGRYFVQVTEIYMTKQYNTTQYARYSLTFLSKVQLKLISRKKYINIWQKGYVLYFLSFMNNAFHSSAKQRIKFYGGTGNLRKIRLMSNVLCNTFSFQN